MLKPLKIIILMLLGVNSFSQQYLNRTYLLNGNYNLIVDILPVDSGYIAFYKYSNTICLLDSFANVKWIKEYPILNYTTSLQDWKQTEDGKYFITGTGQNGTAQKNLIYIIHLDSKFDSIYSRVILKDSIGCNGCLWSNGILLGDSVICLFGAHNKDSMGSATGSQDGLFLKIDYDGNIINHKTFGLSNDEGYRRGINTESSFYLFGATRSYAPAYVTNPFDRTDGWVVKTDMEGNELASAAFGNPEFGDGEFTNCINLPDNKTLTTTSIATFKNLQGFIHTKPLILLLNDDLSVFKEVYFNETYSVGDTLVGRGLVDFTTYDHSSYLFLGLNIEYNMSLYQMIRRTATVTKLDADFRVVFHRDYIHTGNTFNNLNPTEITFTSDGGYIFGGYVVDNTLTPSQQSWLVKTDSLGCDGFTSCNDTALTTEILHPGDTLCKNDTALIHTRFKGRSAPYFVRANGILALDSVYYPYSLPLWIDTLIPFFPTDTGWQQLIVNVSDPWGWNQSDTMLVYVKNCGTSWASEEYYKNKVEVFPSPASTEIRVRMRTGGHGEPYTVTLFDMQGKLVLEQNSSDVETLINIENLVPGMYMVRVMGNRVYRMEKVVKCLNYD